VQERVIPILIGAGTGVLIGVLNAFLLGRLTLSMTTPISLTELLINGVIGCVAVVVIGLVASMLAANRARNNGADPASARNSGLLAGMVPAVLAVVLGMTFPLWFGSIAIQLILAVVSAIYGANRFSQ